MSRPYQKAIGCGIGLALILLAAQAGAQTMAPPAPAPAATGGSAIPAAGADAGRRVYVSPYIELGQVLAADLTNDDTVTYTQVAVGIDAGVQTARTQAQISYRYDRRIEYDDNVGDSDIHSGLAQLSTRLTPALSLEAGAIATRARSDIRGAATSSLAGETPNLTQVYSVYGGPSLSTMVGPAQFNAAYRAGYTKVEVPGLAGLTPGAGRLDYFDDSVSHLVSGSLGVAPLTVLPFGVTVSGAWEREDAGQLDQDYEGWFGRGDVVMPLSRTFAVRGGVGYERIEATQRDALVDANGDPVLDRNGRFVTDPTSPERIAYDFDGLIYDAGVIWRPNPRLELQANAGWRYGGEIYTGSLAWQVDRGTGLNVIVYDGIETFGRQLRDGLAEMPTAFETQPDPFGQNFAGCVFGSRAGTGGGAGQCLNGIFQSISTASYRARGIDAVVSTTMGRSSYGIGAGYAHRRLHAPNRAPGTTIIGQEDESLYGQAFWSYALTRRSAVDASLFANWYDSRLPGAEAVFGAGATGNYTYTFGRLGTIASLGVYAYDDPALEDTQWSAQALLGARYQF